MANFRTHLGVAAVGSGLLASMCLAAEVVSPQEVVLLSVVGTLGGILPDIDLDYSSPTKMMFTALGAVVAFLVMFRHAGRYSIIELWISWSFAYGVIRYLGWRLFADLTVHRGIFHSVAAALFFGFASTTLSYYLFDCSQLLSWVVGMFLFCGYIVHLGLDEIYSVDFMNTRLKRSFGTALKLVDYTNAKTSTMMGGAAVLMYLTTPSAAPFTQALFGSETYQHILQRFWPTGMWFAL